MTARDLTKALRGHWHGTYGTACCPAHDDRRPSLSISERDGKLLVHCFAGCSQEAVWDSLKGMGLVGGDNTEHRRRTPKRRTEPTREAKDRTAAARKIWSTTRLGAATLIETYLRSRGITIPIPPTLRYHPNLKHGPTGLHLPCIRAGLNAEPMLAQNRIFLRVKVHGVDGAGVSASCAGGACLVEVHRRSPLL